MENKTLFGVAPSTIYDLRDKAIDLSLGSDKRFTTEESGILVELLENVLENAIDKGLYQYPPCSQE